MVISKTLKKSQKRLHTVTLKKKNRMKVSQKTIKNYLKNDTNYEKYGIMFNHFKLFFKAIIDNDNKEYNSTERESFDLNKDKVLDKLDDIERKKPILSYIKKTSPDIYEMIDITNDNIPYLELIDVYYKIMNRLDHILEEENSGALRNEASIIQAEMLDEIVNAFMKKKKKNVNTIDDSLLDMFRNMAVATEVDELEELFRGMKTNNKFK